MLVLINITYCNIQQSTLRRLAGLEKSVRGPHVACESVVEPRWCK